MSKMTLKLDDKVINLIEIIKDIMGLDIKSVNIILSEFKDLLQTGGLVKYIITKNKIKKNKTEIEFIFIILEEKSYLIKSTLYIKRRELVLNENDRFIVKIFKDTKRLSNLYSFITNEESPCSKNKEKGVEE